MHRKLPSLATVTALLMTSRITSLIATSGLAQDPAATAAPLAPNPDEIFPDNLIYEGIVVDTKTDLAYVMTGERRRGMKPAGQLEAIRLGSGKAAWKHEQLAQPLGTHGGQLIALADSKKKEHLRILSLDRKSGKVRCDVHVSAKGILHNQIDDDLQTNLDAHLVEWEGKTYVRWVSSFHLVTGMRRRPSPDDNKVVSGLVRFDAKRCKATPVKSGTLPGAKPIEATCVVPGFKTQPPQNTVLFANGKGARISGTIDGSPTIHHANVWLDGCKVLTEPSPYVQILSPIGKDIGRVEVEEKEGKKHYTLVRWDATTGEAKERVALDVEDGENGIRFARDGHFAIVRETKPETDGAPAEYRWQLHAPSGEKITTLPGFESFYNFTVTSKFIVLDSGRVLARKDGEFITQLTPRMTAYNGPMPP
ncbi:MAG: hypothetical protein VYE40_06310 [Myxococcota bacterium]|nr:hypothetical protein [Myxococcota bacterium]